jgi:hypothetical protein
MRRVPFFLLLASHFLFGSQLSISDAIRHSVAQRLGAEFFVQEHKMKSSPSFPKFEELVNKKVQKKINKTQLQVLPYREILKALMALKTESDSIVPSFYAYHLIRLSYGVEDEEINRKYGLVFAKTLSSKRICEGYVWSGLIYERDPLTWRMAKESFAAAKKKCTDDSLLKRARLSYARVNYLISKRNKPENKEAK